MVLSEIRPAFCAGMMKTACVISSAACGLAVFRSATEYTRFTWRETKAAKAVSEFPAAYCCNKSVSVASCIHLIYVRQREKGPNCDSIYGVTISSQTVDSPSFAPTLTERGWRAMQ